MTEKQMIKRFNKIGYSIDFSKGLTGDEYYIIRKYGSTNEYEICERGYLAMLESKLEELESRDRS